MVIKKKLFISISIHNIYFHLFFFSSSISHNIDRIWNEWKQFENYWGNCVNRVFNFMESKKCRHSGEIVVRQLSRQRRLRVAVMLSLLMPFPCSFVSYYYLHYVIHVTSLSVTILESSKKTGTHYVTPLKLLFFYISLSFMIKCHFICSFLPRADENVEQFINDVTWIIKLFTFLWL